MGLAEMIEKGGVYRKLPGSSPQAVLTALVSSLPPSLSLSADKLLEAILEREALMPTGIGNGIALPHPRNPVITEESEQFAALAFPDTKLDWHSLDGKQVDALLLIVSASAKQHLMTLSEITFFCRQEDFVRLLREQAPLEDVLFFIRKDEKKWK
jgi:PTS system nitrogen regulatory IIA component